jgi:large subunit ribosomal protein L13
MKTYAPKPRDIERRWYVIDAQGSVLGRLASETAKILRGKDKPTFAPHADTGDHVVIVNARGVELTGGKETKKIAYRHSGYPGGLTETDYGRLMRERPSFVVEKAVRGMLPKNRLGRQMISKLAVYAGPEHPHQAQKPEPLPVGQVPAWAGLPAPKPKTKTAPTPKAKVARKTAPARSAAAKASTGAGPRRTSARSTSKAASGTVRRGSGASTGSGGRAKGGAAAKTDGSKES